MKLRRIGAIAILGLISLSSGAVAGQATGTAKVGVLAVSGDAGPRPVFIKALAELGYQEGRNLTILFRAATTRNQELPTLAAELVSLRPDVLVAMSTPPSLALKNATSSIPVVMLNIGDPIATGLVQSLAHPGGNVTGTANAVEEWGAKRLQMIAEVLPDIRCVTYLQNPDNQSNMASWPSLAQSGAKLGIEFQVIYAATPEQLDQALAAPLDQRCKAALFLPLDGLFVTRRVRIAEFALHQKIAVFAPFREGAEAGALVAFGINLDDQWRRGATYVDKILKGAKPADLPVEQPTKFELIFNLKTAKALGITITPSLLAGADEVIE
jgi:putative ABC transport system substrate-binding protein